MLTVPGWNALAVAVLCLFSTLSSAAAQPTIAEVLEGESLDPLQVDPEVRDFLDRFNKALTAGDTEAVIGMINSQALCDEIERFMNGQKFEPAMREAFVTGVLPGVAQELCSPQSGMMWERVQIKAVKQTSATTRAVTTRHWHHGSIEGKTIWHLVKDGAGLHLYDIHQIDLGVQWSRVLASLFQQAASFTPESNRAMALLYDGNLSVANGDMELAIQQLLQVDSEALHEAYRGLYLMSLGAAYYGVDKPEEAMAYLDQAMILDEPPPLGRLMRANCLVELERFDEALVEADRYAKEVGIDADVLVTVGDAYVGKEQYDVALRAYEKALEDNPQHLEALGKVLIWLPDHEKASFEKYYVKVENKTEAGQAIAEILLENQDMASLSALLEVHARLHPGDDWVEAYKTHTDNELP